MLDKIDLTEKLGKEEYRHRRSVLRTRLLSLQRACWQHRIPVVIVFEGWKGTDKGGIINALTQPLEPRGFKLHAIQKRRTYETLMPWLWRFWLRIPTYGEIAIFDRSWYRRALGDWVTGNETADTWRRIHRDVTDFERTLADDGYAICKLFLHTSQKKQKKRMRKLESDPLTAWRVTPGDWEQNQRYDDYAAAFEDTLELTESEWAPWTIVEAADKRFARMKVLSTVVNTMTAALETRGHALPGNDYEDNYLQLVEDIDELDKTADPDDNNDNDNDNAGDDT